MQVMIILLTRDNRGRHPLHMKLIHYLLMMKHSGLYFDLWCNTPIRHAATRHARALIDALVDSIFYQN